MPSLAAAPLSVVSAILLGAALTVAIAGIAITRTSDRLADRMGFGEAVMAAGFLGGATSLSGMATSVSAALAGHPELAIANAIGGISVQTAFLSIADISYRQANLEHAAASVGNLMQGALLVALLSIPLLVTSTPDISLGAVHPVTFVLPLIYFIGLRLVASSRREPMWRPRRTAETREDVPAERQGGSGLSRLWVQFALLAALLALTGYLVALAGIELADRTGISETVVGAFLTATATSLAELVTVMAAVRRGALELAVGDIVGGNSFDVLLLAASDLAFRGGSIYHAFTAQHVYLVALPILMTAVLLLGQLQREERGPGTMGMESLVVLLLYAGSLVVLGVGG